MVQCFVQIIYINIEMLISLVIGTFKTNNYHDSIFILLSFLCDLFISNMKSGTTLRQGLQ